MQVFGHLVKHPKVAIFVLEYVYQVGVKMETKEKIKNTIREIESLLLRKNEQYGDSALKPIGLFARGNPEDLIRVRIDDKLRRLVCGDDSIESDEDIVLDLAGYLVLLLITMRDNNG